MSVGESQSSLTMDPSDVVFASKWSLWSSAPSKSSSAQANSWEMKEIFAVDSLASFWRHLNAMKVPSEIGGAIEMALFRTGIQPDWEHEPCSKGGRWSARLDRVGSPDSLDQAWLNLMLGAVGESICGESTNEEILGVAFSGKGQHSRRVSLWVGIREKDRVLQLGNAFKENLRIELTDKDIGEMLFHDFESGNKSFAVIANSAKKDRKSTQKSD